MLYNSVAGTVGAIVTCPLEVVKTRLQSSSSGFHVEVPKIAAEGHNTTQVTCKTVPPEHKRRICTASLQRGSQAQVMTFSGYGLHTSKSMNLVQCLRHIVKHEGTAALFKGLGPNLVGVAPSRAIYFCTYSQAKHFFNNSILPPDTPIVHVCSASAAGFVACTATNPIWFVKTRLQLDHTRFGHMTAAQCIRRIYAQTVSFLYFYNFFQKKILL